MGSSWIPRFRFLGCLTESLMVLFWHLRDELEALPYNAFVEIFKILLYWSILEDVQPTMTQM